MPAVAPKSYEKMPLCENLNFTYPAAVSWRRNVFPFEKNSPPGEQSGQSCNILYLEGEQKDQSGLKVCVSIQTFCRHWFTIELFPAWPTSGSLKASRRHVVRVTLLSCVVGAVDKGTFPIN